MNRASQREKMSLKTYETHKNKDINELNEALPETYGANRNLLPDDTFVLVAFYKRENWDWIIKSGLYNARAESNRGSLKLGPAETGAKYLLLHSDGETTTSKLLKITETGPRVFSKQTLIKKGYPTEPSRNYYLVYKIEKVHDVEFINRSWDITQLNGYKRGRGSGLPFSITLTQLMKVAIK